MLESEGTASGMDYFSMATQALDIMESSASGIDLSGAKIRADSIGVVGNAAECGRSADDGKMLSETYKFIVTLNGYIVRIKTLLQNSELLLNMANEYITSAPLYQYLQMRLSVFDLHLKKMGVTVEMFLLGIYKKMLLWAGRGAICISLQAEYGAILIMIKGCMLALNAILGALDSLMKLVGASPVGINMEGASFFFTIKSSRMSTKMPIVNVSQSIVNKLPPAFYAKIDDAMAKIGGLREIKFAKSVARAAKAGASSISGGLIDLGSVPDEFPNVEIARDTLMRAIDIIMSSVPLAEPMPKYERLFILTNPGFFIFLATGWCVAGKMCFGMPGL